MRAKAWIVVLIAGLVALAYGLSLYAFDVGEQPSERSFGSGDEFDRHILLYIELIAADVINESLEIRLDVAPGPALRGRHTDAPNRDLLILVINGDAIRELVFAADERMTSTTLRVDLEGGSVTRYPLDRYVAPLRIQSFETHGDGPAGGVALPAQIRVWEGMLGYSVNAYPQADSALGDLHLELHLSRMGAFQMFALASYGAMVLLACSSLTIGIMIFLGRRRLEATLLGALGAIVFALPALRNAMPGSPPLGIQADMLIFLWAELAAVTGLGFFVLTWAREGPRPDSRR